MDILNSIIEILVGGITGVSSGVGEGLSTLATSVFLSTDGAGLSYFGKLTVCFAGIGLALGLCRWVVNWVTSLGSRNR